MFYVIIIPKKRQTFNQIDPNANLAKCLEYISLKLKVNCSSKNITVKNSRNFKMMEKKSSDSCQTDSMTRHSIKNNKN